jgi:ABC-type Mn2+/Zn2+ transport system ATPase subunit
LYPHEHHRQDQPILDVHKLSLRYDGHMALEEISFHLHAAEHVAVVGPNGAGKSTLFKLIAGVLPPTSGQVKVYGSGPRGHVCIAYIPQRSQVDWRFPVNVSDVVMMGRSAKLRPLTWPGKSDWQVVRQALATVELEDLARRQIDAIRRQQQRFIARALAREAELMLMDEPLAGLDAPSQEGLLSLLGRLQQAGVTVMVATHDLQQAAQYFDRILLLNRRIVALGPAQQVLQPETLMRAYGGRLRLMEGELGLLAMDDTCCEGEEHGHTH